MPANKDGSNEIKGRIIQIIKLRTKGTFHPDKNDGSVKNDSPGIVTKQTIVLNTDTRITRMNNIILNFLKTLF